MKKLLFKVMKKIKKGQEKKHESFKMLIELIREKEEYNKKGKDSIIESIGNKRELEYWGNRCELYEKRKEELADKLEKICLELTEIERENKIEWVVKKHIKQIKKSNKESKKGLK